MSTPNAASAWNNLFFKNLLLSRAKLRESSRVSALLAGFAMVAIVELQSASTEPAYFDFVIIGGGIAGIVCAETLCQLIRPGRFSGAPVGASCSVGSGQTVAVLSGSELVKTTVNLHRITNLIESFDVKELSGQNWSDQWSGTLSLIADVVERLDPPNHLIYLRKHGPQPAIRYGRLCLSTGGVPRSIQPGHPYVISLRDTESLISFQSRLRGARRVMLVGNGGIATEIAHEVTGCQMIWAIKHSSISTPFLDPSASRFILQAKQIRSDAKATADSEEDAAKATQIRRMRYVVGDASGDDQGDYQVAGEMHLVAADRKTSNNRTGKPSVTGAALGPDWMFGRDLRGMLSGDVDHLKIIRNVTVDCLLQPDQVPSSECADPFASDAKTEYTDGCWPVYVRLSDGKAYGCDLVISAIGVDASFRTFSEHVCRGAQVSTFLGCQFDLAAVPSSIPGSSGEVVGCAGLCVNDQMATSVDCVYAAGDCAFANWAWAPHWFQMRLWSQARQMGFQAAKSMYNHSRGNTRIPLDFSFELFTHVTYFFGFKVVLLGLYNGQGLDLTSPDCYLLMRVTPGQEYIKCVMRSGRMQGALLIGETELEETFENLITNQVDLTSLEDGLLDPSLDLSDYFD